ncbi:MAG: hypothetical protein ACK5RL_13185 [Acidimicrobiales bacterium]
MELARKWSSWISNHPKVTISGLFAVAVGTVALLNDSTSLYDRFFSGDDFEVVAGSTFPETSAASTSSGSTEPVAPTTTEGRVTESDEPTGPGTATGGADTTTSTSKPKTSPAPQPAPKNQTCRWEILAAEFLPGHSEQFICESGARIELSTATGYGTQSPDGANKGSAATADRGITVVLQLGDTKIEVEPSTASGCFGPSIAAAGISDPYTMIDRVEVAVFVDDQVRKTLTVYEDCTGDLEGGGTGDSVTLVYVPAP